MAPPQRLYTRQIHTHCTRIHIIVLIINITAEVLIGIMMMSALFVLSLSDPRTQHIEEFEFGRTRNFESLIHLYSSDIARDIFIITE